MAATSRPLLYAILAASARHLSLIDGSDIYVADRYHRDCLNLLIPILGDQGAARDEALYAATVVLRVFEELSGKYNATLSADGEDLLLAVPLVGQDTQSHFIGTHNFVRTQDYHQLSGIRQAALTVVLRQEIIVAFRSQQPVQLLTEYVQVDRSIKQADDWACAFHAIVLCAEVLTFCYGDEPKTRSAWDGLVSQAQSWLDSKPASFEPFYHPQPDRISGSEVFPEIWLLSDCHGMWSIQLEGSTYSSVCRSGCPPALSSFTDLADGSRSQEAGTGPRKS